MTAAVGAATAVGLSTPASAIGEGTNWVCNNSTPVTPMCPWYLGVGPVLLPTLGPDDSRIFGSRAVIGLVTGFLPTVRFAGEPESQPDHVAFRTIDGTERSRVLVGIVAGEYANGRSAGSTPNAVERQIQVQANGVLATAMGNGDDQLDNPGSIHLNKDTAQGLAPDARAIVASVAASVSGTSMAPLFGADPDGYARALQIMARPSVAQQFADSYPDTDGDGEPDVVTADVIVVDIAEGGDLSGEGYFPRVADAIVHMFDVQIIAPTGDDADAPVPTDQRQQFIFTQSLYSPASGYNVLGVGAIDLPTGARNDNGNCTREYRSQWYQSGRGFVRARNYAQMDTESPSGFREVLNARVGVHLVAPGAKLRVPATTGPAEYVRDENICTLLPEPNEEGPPPIEEQFDPGASTRYAAGYVAGAAALAQDAYKALHEAFPTTYPFDRIPAVTLRALLMNSADRTGRIACWTNESNFYEGHQFFEVAPLGNCQPYSADTTEQALDTSIGAGVLSAAGLLENFQGRAANPDANLPALMATLDVPTTRRDRPFVRIPPNNAALSERGGGFFGGGTPPLNDMDRPLDRPGAPVQGGNPGEIPPDWPYRQLRPRAFGGFENPDTIPTPSALPVRSIGWDVGRVGRGYIDYVTTTPMSAGDVFSATLTWNRTQEIPFPSVSSGASLPSNIRDIESQLEYEDLDLIIFTADSSGNAAQEIGRSATEWSNTELVYFDPSIQDGPGGLPTSGRYIIRVEWAERRYDRFLRLYAADTEFGLAWRQRAVDQNQISAPTLLAGDLNGDGEVGMPDLNMVLASFGQMNFVADANNDGVVNFLDLSLVLSNFGKTSPTFASLD